MQNSLEHKVAVVTGGSSGIGEAIAAALLRNGALVVNADLHPPGLTPQDNWYFFCRTELTSGADIEALYRFVLEKAGSPSILVLNAGRGIHEKLHEGDPEKWFTVVNINIMGTLRPLRAFLPRLMEAPYADVVFTSSVAAGQPYAYGGVYGATKAAVDTIAGTLRLEALDKIRVTVLAPGMVDTSFFHNHEGGPRDMESVSSGSLSASEVAESVLFALTRPAGQAINQITIRPVNQAF